MPKQKDRDENASDASSDVLGRLQTFLAGERLHELRARHGLPTFLSGRTLCARWNDLAAWIERQERR